MVKPETIATRIQVLFAAWNRPTTPQTFLAFELAVSDLSEEQVTQGVTRAIREGNQHPPSAGRLRALCLGTSEDDLTARGIAAFERCDRLARSRGQEANWRNELADPLAVHAIGELGGWQNFCRGKISEWDRRTFVKSYVAAAGNPALAEVARISYSKAVGALADQREQLAASLALPGPTDPPTPTTCDCVAQTV